MMRLISCPDCDYPVSINAHSCPECSNENFYKPVGRPYEFQCWECRGLAMIPVTVSKSADKLLVHYQKCIRCNGKKVTFYRNYANLQDGKFYRIGLWSDGTPDFEAKWKVC